MKCGGESGGEGYGGGGRQWPKLVIQIRIVF